MFPGSASSQGVIASSSQEADAADPRQLDGPPRHPSKAAYLLELGPRVDRSHHC